MRTISGNPTGRIKSPGGQRMVQTYILLQG